MTDTKNTKEVEGIKEELHSLADPEKLSSAKRFFKTQEGEYGHGDIFIGVPVPQTRSIAKKHSKEVTLDTIKHLLASPIHEERMLALLMLVEKFTKAKDPKVRDRLVNFYLDPSNLKGVNNWDLVDTSCYKILGEYILTNPEKATILYDLVKSSTMWHRRIAMVSTMTLIKKGQFDHAIALAKSLLSDKEDLISKAVGWMLKEMGEHNEEALISFLDQHASSMTATAVNYATEKLPKGDREKYKKKK